MKMRHQLTLSACLRYRGFHLSGHQQLQWWGWPRREGKRYSDRRSSWTCPRTSQPGINVVKILLSLAH